MSIGTEWSYKAMEDGNDNIISLNISNAEGKGLRNDLENYIRSIYNNLPERA